MTVTAWSWRLPGLWPDLRWEVTVGEDSVVLHGWLVRATDVAVPDLSVPDALRPWTCVVGDVLARFPTARQIDPDVPSRWLVEVEDGNGDPLQLWFVYGLLQAVTPAPRA